MITVELDPRLTLPPVTGMEHKEQPYKTVPDYTFGEVIEVSLGDLESNIGTTNPGAAESGLLPPDNIVILEQTSKMTDTGQTVIDVLIDVLDVPGAAEYEVRMAVG